MRDQLGHVVLEQHRDLLGQVHLHVGRGRLGLAGCDRDRALHQVPRLGGDLAVRLLVGDAHHELLEGPHRLLGGRPNCAVSLARVEPELLQAGLHPLDVVTGHALRQGAGERHLRRRRRRGGGGGPGRRSTRSPDRGRGERRRRRPDRVGARPVSPDREGARTDRRWRAPRRRSPQVSIAPLPTSPSVRASISAAINIARSVVASAWVSRPFSLPTGLSCGAAALTILEARCDRRARSTRPTALASVRADRSQLPTQRPHLLDDLADHGRTRRASSRPGCAGSSRRRTG